MKMTKIVLVFMLCFTAHAQASSVWDGVKLIIWGKEEEKPPTISVLLGHDLPGVVLETKGRYKIYDPHTRRHIATRNIPKRKFIQPVKDGLRWGEDFPGVHQLVFVPDTPQGTLIVDGLEYKGIIYVFDVSGKLCVVNEVEIEDYISSLLVPKYRDQMHPEALASIAIAARTLALFQAENPRTMYWCVDGRQVGYQGHAVTSCPSKIEEAIKQTRNMVISKTAAYEGTITPIAASFTNNTPHKDHLALSRLSIDEVKMIAESGEHASQILGKAFPETSIQMVQ